MKESGLSLINGPTTPEERRSASQGKGGERESLEHEMNEMKRRAYAGTYLAKRREAMVRCCITSSARSMASQASLTKAGLPGQKQSKEPRRGQSGQEYMSRMCCMSFMALGAESGNEDAAWHSVSGNSLTGGAESAVRGDDVDEQARALRQQRHLLSCVCVCVSPPMR